MKTGAPGRPDARNRTLGYIWTITKRISHPSANDCGWSGEPREREAQQPGSGEIPDILGLSLPFPEELRPRSLPLKDSKVVAATQSLWVKCTCLTVSIVNIFN